MCHFCAGRAKLPGRCTARPGNAVNRHRFRGKGQMSTVSKVPRHAKALVGAPDIVVQIPCRAKAPSRSVRLKIINSVKKKTKK